MPRRSTTAASRSSPPTPGASWRTSHQRADMPHTVVTFGEIMLRLSPPGFERFFQSPVLSAIFGGGEANVAASLAHFGLTSRYITRLPKHAIGDAALRALRAEGIDTTHVLR